MRIFYGINQRIVWIITATLMRTFTNFYVLGKENLRAIPQPLLVVSNHRSYWDAMIIGTLFPFFSNTYLPLGYFATDSLFKYPPIRLFFFCIGAKPTYRGKGLDVSLKYSRDILRKNGTFIIFPHGKIDTDDAGFSAKRGAIQLVRETPSLTILPIYLRTSPNVGIWQFLFGHPEMGVVIGKPFSAESAGNAREDAHISNELKTKILELSKP